MKRMQTSCATAACLTLLACGNGAGAGTGGATAGGSTGATAGAPNGGDGVAGVKPGDRVDLDGDGQKDDGVAVDTNGDGVTDGVDTNNDGQVDVPLPTDGGSGAAGGGTSGGTTAGGSTTGTTPGAGDASIDGGLACNGVGICDDNFRDVCDADPDACPTTQAASIDDPDWDCRSEPPSNVYAYAKFPDGTNVAGANLAPGPCVAFFEGAKGLFYVKWFRFGPANVRADCAEYDGCICPSAAGDNWDRRLYAFTWTGDASCDEVVLVDHAKNADGVKNEQPVSNDCRKYLYALHGDGAPSIRALDGQPAFDLPFSYVAGSLPALKRRLLDFPKIEVSCLEVQGPRIPKAQLMVNDVQTNPGFVAKK